MASAGKYAYPEGTQNGRGRRSDPPDYTPFQERAKQLADLTWEKAVRLNEVLFPERPMGTDPLDQRDQWLILEQVAAELSVTHWDDPTAIRAIYDLRKKFAPRLAHPWLPQLARTAASIQKYSPDLKVTPENPEFEKKLARLNIHTEAA